MSNFNYNYPSHLHSGSNTNAHSGELKHGDWEREKHRHDMGREESEEEDISDVSEDSDIGNFLEDKDKREGSRPLFNKSVSSNDNSRDSHRERYEERKYYPQMLGTSQFREQTSPPMRDMEQLTSTFLSQQPTYDSLPNQHTLSSQHNAELTLSKPFH